jgi:hypothetical protein
MRNKDSAMKSRERKKIYVKELETKNKYLEAECRRLSYALQCHAAENMVLRQSLLKDRPVGAPTAMQESAVLTGKAHQTNMPMLCFFMKRSCSFFLETQYKHTHTRINIYPYKHTYTHPTSMSTSKRLSWLDLEIHEILRFTKSITKSVSLSTGTSPPTERIISRKYNTHVKSII